MKGWVGLALKATQHSAAQCVRVTLATICFAECVVATDVDIGTRNVVCSLLATSSACHFKDPTHDRARSISSQAKASSRNSPQFLLCCFFIVSVEKAWAMTRNRLRHDKTRFHNNYLKMRKAKYLFVSELSFKFLNCVDVWRLFYPVNFVSFLFLFYSLCTILNHWSLFV